MRWWPALLLACFFVYPLPGQAQVAIPTESMGSYYKTPEQKALELYARGMKAKRKAEQEKDPGKQGKLLLKAKEDLSKSVGYHGHYDGYLALGQVYLELAQAESAYDACLMALKLKPGNDTATGCIGEARKRMASTETRP